MDNSIKKFIHYLEEKKGILLGIIQKNVKNAKKVQIQNLIVPFTEILAEKEDLEALIEFLEKEKVDEASEVYKYLRYLSGHLEKSTLTRQEKTDVAFYVLDKNWRRLTWNAEYESDVLDLNVLHELYAPEMSLPELRDFLRKQDLVALVNAEEDSLSREELLLRKKIEETIEQTRNENDILVKLHKCIANHYLLKKEKYNHQDIKIVMESLKKLGMTPTIQANIAKTLSKELEKRECLIAFSNKKTYPVKQEITSAERKEIFKEIMNMYDIQEHRVVTPLTHEKIVYLVSLMLQINIPEVEIKRCIQDINWHGIEAYTNPIEAFNDYYGKLVNNSHYGEVELVIQNIKEYINLSFLPENDIEYNGWKGEIAEELKKVRSIINQDDTYELEEGKKLNLILKNEEEETWKKQKQN